MANPMQQFEVKTIGPKLEVGNFDISFTNASLFMVIVVGAISLLFVLSTQKKSLVPSRMQLLSEMAYEFVAKMISETAGDKARPYFPFI
ncbi:MAG: F0F1 ATP synthase subunit A, partial [Pelagibacteraceae bacterium]